MKKKYCLIIIIALWACISCSKVSQKESSYIITDEEKYDEIKKQRIKEHKDNIKRLRPKEPSQLF